MIWLWRITKPDSIASALTGEGARTHPGRWNLHGDAVVYASATASLAMLEFLAHVDEEDAPKSLYILQIRLPRSPQLLEDKSLPKNWKEIPPPRSTQVLGSKWLQSGRSLALAVPSVLLPTRIDRNVLINPVHRDVARVTIANKIKFTFDTRILAINRATLGKLPRNVRQL